MKKTDFAGFQEQMLLWYGIHARVMPWRKDLSPYRVWISEVMLQQTRVETVIPYFERFMAAFPSVETLAEAEEDKLLKRWEGLGYYNRVRNLKKAAMIVVNQRGGNLPDTKMGWQTLPGIGPYASGSIASIAFGERVSAVDGNVRRILSRIEGKTLDLKQATSLAERLMPEFRIGDFNQSLMELGALVCFPSGQPDCASCPVCDLCVAFREGRPEKFPVKGKKTEIIVEERTVFLIETSAGFAIQKRPADGLLAGMWEFPNVSGTLEREEAYNRVQSWKFQPQVIFSLGKAIHRFTNREWRMTGYRIACLGSGPETFRYVEPESLKNDYPLPTAFRLFQKSLQK